jgi:hypothetical protein
MIRAFGCGGWPMRSRQRDHSLYRGRHDRPIGGCITEDKRGWELVVDLLRSLPAGGNEGHPVFLLGAYGGFTSSGLQMEIHYTWTATI